MIPLIPAKCKPIVINILYQGALLLPAYTTCVTVFYYNCTNKMVQAIMLVQRSGVNDVALPPDAAIDCSWFMRCALNLSRLSSSCLLDCLREETTPFVCPFMWCPFIFVPPFMWWSWMVLLLEFSSILFFFSAFSFCTLLLLSTSTELWLHPICQSM